MKAGYCYDAKICARCGNLVHYNWYIRHRRSGCVSGIVTPPRLTCVRSDGCAGDSTPIAEVEPGAAAAQLGR